MDELEVLLDEYVCTVEPLKYELFSTCDVAPNIITSPDEQFVHIANATLNEVSGDERSLTGYAQSIDGRWFAAVGFSIILCGTSESTVAHAVVEFVKIDQLVEAARVLALFVMRWLK